MSFKFVGVRGVGILAVGWPEAVRRSQAYFLGYGRNAWSSTWANRYYSDAVSFDLGSLKREAESLRVQGSVFKIESAPLLIMRYPTDVFGLLCINDRSEVDYARVINKWNARLISSDPPWDALPGSFENWMLIFKLPRDIDFPEAFTPWKINSNSYGSRYSLGWATAKPNSYPHFQSFLGKLMWRRRENSGWHASSKRTNS